MRGFPSRDIASQRSRDVPRDVLQSLCILELLEPSRPLWILSPWISNVALIDNRGGRFAAVEPEWTNADIRLLTVLCALSARGGEINIVTNDAQHNDEFGRRVEELDDNSIRFIRDKYLHAKGIVSEHFVVSGSMNLTHSGVFRNDEHLFYETDPARVHEWRIDLDQRWGLGQ